ncbi:LOW QUALITY PROTEIN: uncharacterized protein VSU04_007815 [Chlamydotis macqueenii]
MAIQLTKGLVCNSSINRQTTTSSANRIVLLVPMLFGTQALCSWAASPPAREATALPSLTCDATAVEESADLALRQINADQKEGYILGLYRIFSVQEHTQEITGSVFCLFLDEVDTECHVLSKKLWKNCTARFVHTTVGILFSYLISGMMSYSVTTDDSKMPTYAYLAGSRQITFCKGSVVNSHLKHEQFVTISCEIYSLQNHPTEEGKQHANQTPGKSSQNHQQAFPSETNPFSLHLEKNVSWVKILPLSTEEISFQIQKDGKPVPPEAVGSTLSLDGEKTEVDKPDLMKSVTGAVILPFPEVLSLSGPGEAKETNFILQPLLPKKPTKV